MKKQLYFLIVVTFVSNMYGAYEYSLNSFLNACCQGDLQTVQVYIDKGFNINAQDQNERTAALCAASRGHTEVLKTLIYAGADLNIIDRDGVTPLHYAVRSGNLEIIQLLLNFGADFDISGHEGNTPLHDAVVQEYAGVKNVVKALLDANANVHAQDDTGGTPLAWAIYFGNVDVAQLLLEYGSEVNVQDNGGDTPLHNAVMFGDVLASALLLTAGADPFISSEEGTVFDLLAASRYEDQLEYEKMVLLFVQNMDYVKYHARFNISRQEYDIAYNTLHSKMNRDFLFRHGLQSTSQHPMHPLQQLHRFRKSVVHSKKKFKL